MGARRFGIITEADARTLEPGSTVELEAGGHVTPLARDTLAARRITVVPAGQSDPHLPADLPPPAVINRVAIGGDHTGTALTTALVEHLRKAGKAVSVQSTSEADYPDIAAAVAKAVARGEADAGVVIDATGISSAVAANKVRGIRAAMCQNVTLARHAREHAGSNVLTLGATLVNVAEAKAIVDAWISTPMRDARYIRPLLKVRRLEDTF